MSEPTVALEALGFEPHFRAALDDLGGAFEAGRVAIAYGEAYVVWTASGPRTGILTGRRLREWRGVPERPQVGDWVAGTFSESADSWIIEHVLPRQTCLMRMAAGIRVAPQVMAANVDVVGIVSALGEGGHAVQQRLINEGRLRRYLAAVEQSGAKPLLILNKVDLSAESVAVQEQLAGLFPDVPLVSTSATEPNGLQALHAWLQPTKTLGLLGTSGVGKSTMVNALVERNTQRVGEVRAGDARGRHTTTHRELFQLTSGALILDMPGTREFAVWGEDSKVEHLRGRRPPSTRHR